MKKVIVLLLSLALLVLLVVGCGQQSSDTTKSAAATHSTAQAEKTAEIEKPAEVWVMKLSHANAANSLWQKDCEKFAQLVEEGTNGAIKIEIYSDSQLGDIRTVCESLITGNIELCVNGGGYLGNYSQAYQLMEMPYLFSSNEHMNKALTGEAGALANVELEENGLKVLSWWNRTPRQTLSRKPVNSIDDIAGLKIRVPEIDAHVVAWQAMGTNPTPITWGEVFTSAQQGIVDAVENPVSTMYDAGLHEPLKYLAMTNHCYSNGALFIGTVTWNKLTPEQQQVFIDAAQETKLFNDEETDKEEAEYVAKMEEAGVTVTYPDVAAFKEAAMAAHQELAAKYSTEFYELVKAADN